MATAVVDYGPEERAMQAYFREGEARAMALDNRGPLRLTDDGKLHPDILDTYHRFGFYVFEGAISDEELAELKAEFHDMVDRLPTGPDSEVDHRGRPALGLGLPGPVVGWSKPLGDPLGGTDLANGRHMVKMFEPVPAPDLPEQVPFTIVSPPQYSEATLRVTGHPALLAVAETIHGEDFVPFTEAMIFKKPGEGASFAWHQDGTTHWSAPDWDMDTHGFNFMVQLYGSTAANGVWFLPGTHATGRMDLAAVLAEVGSDRMPNAVPLISNPGDIAISNRQIVHGSFANTSPDWRVTLNFGFHRRRSILGATGFGYDNAKAPYDAERIRKRSEMIGYAIDARHQRFPGEKPFVYQPHARAGQSFHWDEAAKAATWGYNKNDLII
jgi:hypothetical protein